MESCFQHSLWKLGFASWDPCSSRSVARIVQLCTSVCSSSPEAWRWGSCCISCILTTPGKWLWQWSLRVAQQSDVTRHEGTLKACHSLFLTRCPALLMHYFWCQVLLILCEQMNKAKHEAQPVHNTVLRSIDAASAVGDDPSTWRRCFQSPKERLSQWRIFTEDKIGAVSKESTYYFWRDINKLKSLEAVVGVGDISFDPEISTVKIVSNNISHKRIDLDPKWQGNKCLGIRSDRTKRINGLCE